MAKHVDPQSSPESLTSPDAASAATRWQQELAIIDQTMKNISGVNDPQKLVELYWDGIAELHPITDYVALSRRDVDEPEFLVTRSTRFENDINPWTHRHQLPRLRGGLLGELAYAEAPVWIENLPARLERSDPGWFYLQGYEKLIALPQYDSGRAMNVAIMLLKPGQDFDLANIPQMHWHSSLFGRGTQALVLRNKLAHALEQLDSELKAVGMIQRSLLPDKLPAIAGYDFAAHYQTSARAGGDYYDFFQLADDQLGIFIADVSGHGTPAAVLMAITHALAHAQPHSHTPPGKLLGQLNRQLIKAYLRGGMFVTAFYATLDPATGKFTYARAGHNPPRLYHEGRVESLDHIGSLPLGILEDETYEEHCVTLAPDDMLLLYTDGITEAMGLADHDGQQELFGLQRLDDVLRRSATLGAQRCLDDVRQQVHLFSQTSVPTDDQTLLTIHRGA